MLGRRQQVVAVETKVLQGTAEAQRTGSKRNSKNEERFAQKARKEEREFR